MRRLLLETSVPKIYMLVMISISILMLGGYFSYAMFTVQKEKKNAISIVTGNLTGILTVDGESSNKLVVAANTSKNFTVVLSNNNARKARYNFYYTGTLASNISAGYVEEEGSNTPPKETGMILEASGSAGSSASYNIKVKNNTNSIVTITLGYKVGLENIDLSIPNNSHLFTEALRSPNLVETLVASHTNPASVATYVAGDKTKMYTFQQKAGEQQVGYTKEELVDYRYIGNIPNNYIRFNDELWRIIGIFTVEDELGRKQRHVKLIRNESIGNYVWDNTTVEGARGKNHWNDARLMKLLNENYENDTDIGGSLYWNRQKGPCEMGTCDFTTTGLKTTVKNWIQKVKWYLGGYDTSPTPNAAIFYEKERSKLIYESTIFPRNTTWLGHVGLIYPSDYGYTFAMGVNTTGYNNLFNINSDIAINSWLFQSDFYQWTLTCPVSSLASDAVFPISNRGEIDINYANSDHAIRPVVFLKPELKLSGGSGTSSNPFQIEE